VQCIMVVISPDKVVNIRVTGTEYASLCVGPIKIIVTKAVFA
jgi:hypothetical protein